ncbi:hypothetical protein B0H13DRAFT_1517384, partial [Mycena leptocephala]
YKKKTSSKADRSTTTYTFYCAQLKAKESRHSLVDNLQKRRAWMKMDCFECDGWLHITVNNNDLRIATVQMAHHRCHTPYVDISIPKEVKQTDESTKHLPTSKVSYAHIWEAALKADPQTEFNEKQIY